MRSDQQVYYKGKRKRLNVLAIVAFSIALLILVLLLSFYSLQKYIVYGHDGVKLELPILKQETHVDASGEVTEFAPVDAELSVKEPNYAEIPAVAGENLAPLKVLYVPAEFMTTEGLEKYKSIMPMYGATGLILDVKPNSGYLFWQSNCAVATGFLTNGSGDLAAIVKSLKDEGIYVGARLSCCLDSRLADMAPSTVLRTAGGGLLTNAEGMWLDPYNSTVRTYIIELCEELAKFGVDEVFLDNVRIPVTDTGVGYTVSLSFQPTPKSAVCSFALYVTRALKNSGLKISAILSEETLHTSNADVTGQYTPLFGKVFDRLTCPANSAWQYNFDRDNLSASFEKGNVADRYPALMNFYPPEASSWIILVPEALTNPPKT
ncbi:MAG: hypothetical protein GX684_06950 [Ruminococcaceae bacterium]|nr:hypothetical protein [Oscillospiraceae bacterium]